MTVIAFSRAIGPVPLDCVVSEKHASDVELTEIPIESGARITDHAFILPKKVTLDVIDRKAVATYNALVSLEEARTPFTLVTGLYVYQNMMITRLTPERDKEFGRVLRCTVELQEAIIVSTAYTADESGRTNGEPGGKDSTKSSRLTKDRAGDDTTADRVTNTSQRGDVETKTVTDSSLLYQLTGSD